MTDTLQDEFTAQQQDVVKYLQDKLKRLLDENFKLQVHAGKACRCERHVASLVEGVQAANSILTEENEQLRKENEELRRICKSEEPHEHRRP